MAARDEVLYGGAAGGGKTEALEALPVHVRRDAMRRAENMAYPPIVCERCDGTGNELLSMYRQCQACGGRGYVALSGVSA